jgi:ferredoxin
MMLDAPLTSGSIVTIPKAELDALMTDLRTNGYIPIGPSVQNESIVYKEVSSLKDLPLGITSEQSPSSYRIHHTGRERYFNFIPGGQSWKQFLFPPSCSLFSMVKDKDWKLKKEKELVPRYAFIGVRACEMAAIAIQDKIFLRSDFSDPIYKSRREGLLIIAVNCLAPNSTCFCTSMGTGPRVGSGFDLCLTEMDELFLVEIGSELGRSLIASRKYSLPSGYIQNTASTDIARAVELITRSMDTQNLPEFLFNNLEAEQWNDVGKRCLSCANCTLVCPTCFCWDAKDNVDVSGKNTSRERLWDSCFNINYSYVFGGNTRPSIRSRYRQWLTHKLGAWVSQFGMLGCVGCGRCITWCPAGIDLTEEVAALRREATR